ACERGGHCAGGEGCKRERDLTPVSSHAVRAKGGGSDSASPRLKNRSVPARLTLPLKSNHGVRRHGDQCLHTLEPARNLDLQACTIGQHEHVSAVGFATATWLRFESTRAPR